MPTPSGPPGTPRPSAVPDALRAADLPLRPWESDLRAAVEAARARRRRLPSGHDRSRARPTARTR